MEPKPVEDAALEAHVLLRMHETSIVERHLSWLVGHERGTDKPRLRQLCKTLWRYAGEKDGTPRSRIAALKAIFSLAVEDPYTRETFRKCYSAFQNLPLKGASWVSKSEYRLWVARTEYAVENEDIQKLWSYVITSPLSKDKKLSYESSYAANFLAKLAKLASFSSVISDPNSESDGETIKRLVRLARFPKSSDPDLMVGSELYEILRLTSQELDINIDADTREKVAGFLKLRDSKRSGDNGVVKDLALSLIDIEASCLANFYVKVATKLVVDGPSASNIRVINRHIRRILRDKSTSDQHNDQRPKRLKLLFGKLCKFVTHHNTQVAALKEIIALSMEDYRAREALRECGCIPLLQKYLSKQTWASRVLYVIENDGVHNHWKIVIPGPKSWRDGQILKDEDVASVADHLSRLKSYDQPDRCSSDLGGWYFDYAVSQAVRNIACQIPLLLQHNKTSIVDRYTGRCPTNLDQAEQRSLKTWCRMLLEYARSDIVPLRTRITAMDTVIALTIEDPYVRETLKHCEEFRRSLEVIKGNQNPRICRWASKALLAVEDEYINKIWTKAFNETMNQHFLQHLSNRDAYDSRLLGEAKKERELRDNPKLKEPMDAFKLYGPKPFASKIEGDDFLTLTFVEVEGLIELAESLNSVDRDASFLAARYLERAMGLVNGGNSVQQMRCILCYHIDQISHEMHKGQTDVKKSKDLLEYVLDSIPEDSIRNLSGAVELEKLRVPLGQGGFSYVYKYFVEGKYVAVKKLLISEQSEAFVIKNFARELRVWARITHSNVSTLLGYVQERERNTYCILSEWMEEGSLETKMEESMPVEQLFTLSLGIAKGMCFLHENNVVHADLKTANVLVSRSGEPLLTDFGISTMTESIYSKGFYTTNNSRGSNRWLPYEYFSGEDEEIFRFTAKTDVWAFGMTILELLTGRVPYGHIRCEGRVAKAIFDRSGPMEKEPSYEGAKKEMWSLLMDCWRIIPGDRPSMRVALERIIKIKYRHAIML